MRTNFYPAACAEARQADLVPAVVPPLSSDEGEAQEVWHPQGARLRLRPLRAPRRHTRRGESVAIYKVVTGQ